GSIRCVEREHWAVVQGVVDVELAFNLRPAEFDDFRKPQVKLVDARLEERFWWNEVDQHRGVRACGEVATERWRDLRIGHRAECLLRRTGEADEVRADTSVPGQWIHAEQLELHLSRPWGHDVAIVLQSRGFLTGCLSVRARSGPKQVRHEWI